MLQRPRNILISEDLLHFKDITSSLTFRDYQDTRTPGTQLHKRGPLNCSFWDKTTAQLAARWGKTIAKRRFHSFKRSMVKQLAAEKNVASYSTDSKTLPGSPTTIQVSAYGGGPCPRGNSVCEDNSDRAYVGRNQGSSTSRGLAGNTDLMEQNKAALAAQRSKSDREDREGEIRLTPEQYIAHRKQLAVEKVMSGFQKWLDKRLAIISYTIEASEAADGAGPGGRGTGSQSRRTDEKMSSGAGSRQKRQFSDDDNADDVPGGDDNGQDRGGNKRAKKDTDPEEVKLACPFHKHNPNAHRKELCMKGGWRSIHRLKEHLYRIHLLPKHKCARCYSSFGDDKELQAHLRADEPCKKSDIALEEGIDQDTERKLRERKKHNSGQTEAQRWTEIYLLLFPGADQDAIPSPYPDYDATATQSKNIERYKRREKRIKKELPRLVRKAVETKFEKVEVEMLRGVDDVIRHCLADFFKNNMSQEDGSSTTTPQTASRATTPGLTSLEEPCVPAVEQGFEPQLDLDYFFNNPDLGFGSDISFFNYNPQYSAAFGEEEYGVDKVSSDSGYMSTLP